MKFQIANQIQIMKYSFQAKHLTVKDFLQCETDEVNEIGIFKMSTETTWILGNDKVQNKRNFNPSHYCQHPNHALKY